MLEWQRKHVWGNSRELGTVTDGVGKTLGVLGYGAIGRQSKIPLVRKFEGMETNVC